MHYKNGEEIMVGDLARGPARDSLHDVSGVVCGFEKVGNDPIIIMAMTVVGSKTTKHFELSGVPLIVQKFYAEDKTLELVWRK